MEDRTYRGPFLRARTIKKRIVRFAFFDARLLIPAILAISAGIDKLITSVLPFCYPLCANQINHLASFGSTFRHQIQVNDTARSRLLPLFAPAQNADH